MEGLMSRSSKVVAHAARLLFVSLSSVALFGCPADIDDTPPGVIPPEGLAVPFAISEHWAASGFMGDGADGVSLTGGLPGENCGPRPEGVEGDCYRFDYTPSTLLWSGVYWQSPADNWGSAEGVKIQPGATKVTFWAASADGGQTLKVKVGGIKDPLLPNKDTLDVESSVVLTTEMTKFTIDLTGSYDKVLGAFAWFANYPQGTDPATATPMTLFFDGIVWE
jgi:hypothetical protein